MIVSIKPLFRHGNEMIPVGTILSGSSEFPPEKLERLVANGSAKDVPVCTPEILAQVREDYERALYDLELTKREMRLPGLEKEEPAKAHVRKTVTFTQEELAEAARLPHIAAAIAASNTRLGLQRPAKRDQSAHMLTPPPRISPAPEH
jgi:hypothetical protein